jgi:inner membrane protein
VILINVAINERKMVPQQHLVISWVLSNFNYESRRDRIVTTLCGVLPDVDGLGFVLDKINGDQSFSHYIQWHRTFGHNIFTFLSIAVITFFLCKRKLRPVLVALMIFSVHMFFDLVGSAGPEGSIWPLYPFWPVNDYEFSVPWQWALNDWKNIAITAVFIVLMLVMAVKKRRSFLEIISTRLDLYCINHLEHIFKRKAD